MRRPLLTAAAFAVVLWLTLQALSGSGPLDDREVRLAVVLAAIAALLAFRRLRR